MAVLKWSLFDLNKKDTEFAVRFAILVFAWFETKI
jgi:hypothetical protein